MSENACPNKKTLLLFYQQQLDRPAEWKLTQHLNECSICRDELDAMYPSVDLFRWIKVPKTGGLFETSQPFDTALNAIKASLPIENHTADSWQEFSTWLDPADDPKLIGRIDEFDLIEAIGRGGMGAVFKAFDRKLERIVAIKIMSPSLIGAKVSTKRFLREARAVARINHRNVVSVYSVDQIRGLPYLVMEFVKGKSLQHLLRKVRKLRLRSALQVSKRVALGLAAAHEKGIIHRDVKPANILIATGGKRIKLTDFGLARTSENVLTESGHLLGTPEFLAPEQFQFDELDHRVDLFSLGSVMYLLLTGQVPFTGQSPHAIMNRISSSQPTPIHELTPNVPDEVASLVEHLLQKDPNDRPDTAADVANSIQQLLDKSKRPSRTQPVIVKNANRKRTTRTAKAWPKSSLALIAVVAFLVFGWLGFPSKEARNSFRASTFTKKVNANDGLSTFSASTKSATVTKAFEANVVLRNSHQWTDFFETLEDSDWPSVLTIELAFNELVCISPIEIFDRKLTLVPAEGFRPKISFDLDELEACIVVEEGGIEMRDIKVAVSCSEAMDPVDDEELAAGIIHAANARVVLTRCQLTTDGFGCLNLEESNCTLKNCEILSSDEVGIHFATDTGHHLTIEDCLLRGDEILSVEPSGRCNIELHRNNFVGGIAIALFVPTPDRARIEIRASDNNFGVADSMLSLEEIEFENESEIHEIIRWQGQSNQLPETLLRYVSDEKGRWNLIQSTDRFVELGFRETASTRSTVGAGQQRLVQKRR